MTTSVITLKDFVKYHELPTESISEEFGRGTAKQNLSVKLPMISGQRALREIIPHIWNFNAVIQGKAVTEDMKKTLGHPENKFFTLL